MDKGANFRVADWQQALVGHPEYLVDPVHPSPAGSVVLAQAIHQAAQGCP